METEKQYTALDYAVLLDAGAADDHDGDIAAELRRLHDKVIELEARLASVGAGGASAQRITQGKDHIEQPIEMVAAPVVLPEPVAAQIRHIKEERWRTIALVLYDLFAGDEYERRYIYTEQQVRELLATATQVTEKAAKYDHLLPYLCKTCGGYGLLDSRSNDDPLGSEPCPDCNAPAQPQADARDAEQPPRPRRRPHGDTLDEAADYRGRKGE